MKLPGQRAQLDDMHLLRLAAEARLGLESAQQTEGLPRELQIIQVELEMQNEALRQAQAELQVSRERYADFYENSPVGYLTLCAQGLITDINRCGAELLATERAKLLQMPFSNFVAAESADQWHAYFSSTLTRDEQVGCELLLRRSGASPIPVRLECLRVATDGHPVMVRIVMTDITRQHEVETELFDSRQLLREIGEIGRVGGWEIDIATGRHTWTEEMYRIHEVDFYHLPNVDNWLDFHASESRPAIERAMQRAVAHGESFDLDLQIVTAKGSLRHVRSMARTDLARGRVVGFVQDITERMLAQAGAVQSRELLRRFIDSTPSEIFALDLEHRFSLVNQRLARSCGMRVQEMVGNTLYDVLPMEVADRLSEVNRRVMATGEPLFIEEVVTTKFSSTPRTVMTSKFPLRDAAGKIIGMGGVATDITVRKRMEEALRMSEEKYRKLAEDMPVFIVSFQPDGTLTYVNEAYCDRVSMTREELTWTSFFDFLPADDMEMVRAHLAALTPTQSTVTYEQLFHRTGQPDAWHKWTHRAFFDDSGRAVGFQGIGEDITAQKKAQAGLLVAVADAKKANAAKSRFLAAASHDLRQPLAALSLYVGALSRDRSADDLDLVKSIETCVASLNDLLTDILDVSKLDAGVVKMSLKSFALDDLLAEIISVHSVEAKLKNLQLRWRDSGAIVRTDHGLLARILNNLVANAISYTDKGAVLVACRRHGGKLWVEVWDTGRGIPEDKRGIIFDEFVQLEDAARTKGSGLGLAIVAKAAAVLGQEIRVRSWPGRGSMFAVEVPLGTMEEKVPSLAATVKVARQLRIGVVEDNDEVRNALMQFLEQKGHEVVAAASGGMLLQGLDGRAPQLIIADFRLADGETGFDAILAARRQFGENLPAIVVTGDTDPALIRSMSDRGIAVYYKPLKVGTLLNLIGEIGGRAATR